MVNKKKLFFLLAMTSSAHACLFQTTLNEPESSDAAPIHSYLRTPTKRDKALWKNIKSAGLLFEKEDRSFAQMMGDLVWQRDPYIARQRKVNNTLRTKHGAEQQVLTTHDGEKISTLVRKVKNAKINLVIVTGYFAHQTPSKEWSGPLYGLFDDCNLVSFDWRSSGQSTGKFSHNAIYDVRAMLNLCKTDEHLKKSKTVLMSFCLGGAIALEALHPLLHEHSLLLPDAVVISCTPSVIADMRKKDRAVPLAPNAVMRGAASVGVIRRFLIDYFLDPTIQKMEPVHQLPELTLPVCFEQCAKNDPAVPMQDLANNYHASCNAPTRHVIVSEPANHVRLYKEMPHQYRQAHLSFFHRAGLIDAVTYQQMSSHKPLEHTAAVTSASST